jgi:hypothetical protein
MKICSKVLALAALAVFASCRGDAADVEAKAGKAMTKNLPVQRASFGRAPVNGLNMYYEIHGAGQPLVLLHGALSTAETGSGKPLPTLANPRQVIAIKQPTHTHTADIDRPLRGTDQRAGNNAEVLR